MTVCRIKLLLLDKKLVRGYDDYSNLCTVTLSLDGIVVKTIQGNINGLDNSNASLTADVSTNNNVWTQGECLHMRINYVVAT